MVFDALHELGVVDPLLSKDWTELTEERPYYEKQIQSVLKAVNQSPPHLDELVETLGRFDERTLEFLAMEVAREYADYSARQVLH